MPFQSSLFESAPSFDRQALASKVHGLSSRKIFLGTSSWRYEGWLGQIYTPDRYFTRGKFSKTKFHAESIQEYAETFPIVGGDFSFYSIPEPSFWKKVFTPAPMHLKWDLKVPEDFTTKRFSKQPRYGARAGLDNPTFLDAEAFQGAFLDPLTPFLDRVGVFLFEFGTFSKASYAEPGMFYDDLDAFLRRLPREFRYSIEIRNEEYLNPEYFQVLKSNGAAHTFNSWTRMPSLRRQVIISEAFTGPFTAARALLRPGRSYEQAVEMYSPYTEIKEEYPSARQALRDIIAQARERDIAAYIHVNNRFEGNAIQTIDGVLSAIDI